MVLVALAVTLHAQVPPAETPDQVRAMRGTQSWELNWSDAEDTLHGVVGSCSVCCGWVSMAVLISVPP